MFMAMNLLEQKSAMTVAYELQLQLQQLKKWLENTIVILDPILIRWISR
jgi:hypothetical protein